MPHIKVKAFEVERLDDLITRSPHFTFRAIDLHDQHQMLGASYEDELFMLEIKPKGDALQIKPDSISRPLNVNKIKGILDLLIRELKLEVLHSNIAISANKPPLAERYNKKIRDFENPQFSHDKIAIEVGFGSGRHLLYQAQQHPETLFIGIEIHTPSAEQVLKQIALQKLENIWIVNYDARLLLEMMPSNSCSHIYVHFPVPWDKKPHRRVISENFLKESLRVLEVGGELELRTDSNHYYAHALETFSLPPKIDFKVEKNRDLPIISKYEDRWRAQEKDIYTLIVTAREQSTDRNRTYDFSFVPTNNLQLESLPTKASVAPEYFIHFERQYHIANSDNRMVRCAFGSFDKPEHKYLMQRGDTLYYYPQNPVKTEVNYLAHQQIGAHLYG